MANNSESAPSKKKKHCLKFNYLWCNKLKFRNPGQVKVLRYIMCEEAILVLHMEEISNYTIDTRAPQSIRDT